MRSVFLFLVLVAAFASISSAVFQNYVECVQNCPDTPGIADCTQNYCSYFDMSSFQQLSPAAQCSFDCIWDYRACQRGYRYETEYHDEDGVVDKAISAQCDPPNAECRRQYGPDIDDVCGTARNLCIGKIVEAYCQPFEAACKSNCGDKSSSTTSGSSSTATDKCANVRCEQKACDGDTLKTGGQCNPDTGSCVFASEEKCANGCDASTISCYDKSLLCRNKNCDNSCKKTPGNFDHALRNGKCNDNTGECEYEIDNTCTYKCEKATCLEDCDNGADDDGNNLADCKDPACSKSLYCSCPLVAKSGNGKRLKIAFGGSEYANGPSYIERDAKAQEQAQTVWNSLQSTTPFNEFGIELYATRLPKGAGRADLLARCPSDVTILYYDQTSGHSSSDAFSNNMYIYNANLEGPLGNVVMHELGHAFGGLWDEYNLSALTSIKKLDLWARYTRTNCAVAVTTAGCEEYFRTIINDTSRFTCVQGCSAKHWFRASPTSIMLDQNQYSQFNPISEAVLRTRFRSFGSSAPAIAATVPPESTAAN